eukprot:GFUD01090260.1.p1 GENE.GFUD01090260.1~~GFUD01090260.1.p1  ORF type:complete len:121 (+),score=33.54 GFUD01090260.1:48-365(+)
MKGGSDCQQYVDLLVPTMAQLKLLQGEEPINLIGSHCVDFSGFRDVAGDTEDEDEGTDDNIEKEEDEQVVQDQCDKTKTSTKESKEEEKTVKITNPDKKASPAKK